MIRTLVRDNGGGSAAEFALVLPILLIFLLGIFDVGRLMWTWNRAEKATQMGVRYAVATDMVPTGLANYSFASQGGIAQGQPIGSSVFDSMSCTSTTCDPATKPCQGTLCGSLVTPFNSTAFTAIVNRMKRFYPDISATNVTVDYKNVGIGYAGDPNGPDVSPLVTVSLKQLTFQPILFTLFRGSITLPSFSAALTMEDGQGTVSN